MYRKSPSKIWRKKQNIYSITGSKSTRSGKVYYPPINYESEINNTEFDTFEFEQKGKLITWSIVKVAPEGFEKQTPYAVGIIELDNGERLTGQIVDIDYNTLQKGDILYPTFRKIYEDGEDGIIHYGIKWSR